MLSFVPGLRIENELKTLQGTLAEICKSLEAMSTEEAANLHRFAFISNIGASTRIENAVLTDREIEWVDSTLGQDSRPTAFELQREFIVDKLSKDRERSIEEVVGCRQMLHTVYLQAEELLPLTETTIRALHHDLMRFYPPAGYHAGNYKKAPNRVVSVNHKTGEERVVLEPAPPGIMTETAMSDLITWYNRVIREFPWPLLVASEFVFRFLAIHPFQDGNGRLGRALFILTLLQSGDKYWQRIVPFLSVDRHIEQNRYLYYTTLHRAARGRFNPDPGQYDLKPVAQFFIRIVYASLDDIDIYRKRFAAQLKLSESALAVLDTFKDSPEKRLKAGDIVEKTGLPRRTVQYALKTLVDSGSIQRLGQGAGTRYQLVF